MRLLWLLPLLMAAVTFALPRRHQPDKNPTIPILGTAAVAGSAAAVAVEALGEAGKKTSGETESEWTANDKRRCLAEGLVFWDQFFLQPGYPPGGYEMLDNLKDGCSTREGAAKLRAYWKEQKEGGAKKLQNVPESEVLHPQKIGEEADQETVHDNTAVDPGSAEESEAQNNNGGDDTWNKLASAAGGGITLGTMGLVAGGQVFGGQGNSGMQAAN